MARRRACNRLVPLVLAIPGLASAGRPDPDIDIDIIITPPAEFFLRGDSNVDHTINIADPVRVLNYLFTGGESVYCLEAADSNDDGTVNIADAVSLLNFLFVGGPDPQSPFQQCGIDLTDDAIVCGYYPFCTEFDSLQVAAYKLRDNGQRCPEEPCFWITATQVGIPTTLLLSAIDVSHFEAADEEALTGAFVQENSRLLAIGFLQEGPAGPAGMGMTVVVLATTIDHAPDPDLTVDGLTVQNPTFPRGGGIDVPVRVRVSNLSVATQGDFAVQLRQGKLTLDSWRMGPFDSATSATVTRTLHFAASPERTSVTITAFVDAAGEIREAVETNNTRSVTLTFPGEDDCFIEIINGKPVRICP